MTETPPPVPPGSCVRGTPFADDSPPRRAVNGHSLRGALHSGAIFVRRFLSDPRSVGALAPSSRFLARRMADLVRWDPGITVVEFGPGTGAFTVEILRRLPADGRYLGIERDPVFVRLLEERFPGAEFEADSVASLEAISARRGLPSIDHVISGLPFASLPLRVTEDIVATMARSLRPGGTFSTFQYVHAYPLPSARFFRALMRRTFGECSRSSIEARNLPPAFVFSWEKRND